MIEVRARKSMPPGNPGWWEGERRVCRGFSEGACPSGKPGCGIRSLRLSPQGGRRAVVVSHSVKS